jgi:AcrR family transcriptional regulator
VAAQAGPASAGRPRRFEPADELRLLFDATLRVMERNGYADASVAGILAEAGVSTRSFYRHFLSKDQLLCALYRAEAERVAERIRTRVSAAPSPLAALDSWIEEIINLGFHRGKAARVALMSSPGAMRAEGYGDEIRYAATLLTGPLEALLAAGRRDGTYPLADPVPDARHIRSVTWAAAGLNPLREISGSQEQSVAAVRSFCWRALGVVPRGLAIHYPTRGRRNSDMRLSAFTVPA